ncbi:MAG: tetratricopeptide repeat protein [Acidobacteria bacterium]|nr:tetratricopeptide repeat protein [Acidobacteriota bacterium]
MSETVIGRMLVASLHQAISELLPMRLEFYESWINSGRMRSHRVTLGAMRAVFSFLRQEEGGVYDTVMTRAGELTAQWTVEGLTPVRRAWLRRLPSWLRERAAGRLARRIAVDTWQDTRASVRWRRGRGTLVFRPSLFCDVRATSATALCRYYAAAASGVAQALNVRVDVTVDQCLARGDAHCAVTVDSSRVYRPAAIAAPLLAMACAIMPGPALAQTAVPVAASRERALVMPFESNTRDPRLSWLGEASAVVLTESLRGAGVDAIVRSERLGAFERLQVPPFAALSRATVVRIGQLVGAADVVIGSVTAEGDMLAFTARRLRLGQGRIEAPTVVRGKLPDVFVILTRLASGLAFSGVVLETGRAAPAPTPPPLAAFEAYVKGLLAQTPAAQVRFLHTALQAAPSYDVARLALWQAHTSAGEHRAALEAVRAVPDDSPVAVEARLLASVSDIRVGEYADAYRLLTGLRQRAPSAIVQNNLGVLRLRAPSLPSDAARAVTYFSDARALDPLDPDYVFNLGYATWLDGDSQSAASWLREAVRLSPADGAAHALLATVLQAAGQSAEASRELLLAQRLSSAYDSLDLRAAAASRTRGQARLKEAIEPPRAERVDATVELIGQRDQRDLAAFYLDRGRRLVDQGNDREAEGELKRALYLAPYDPDANLLVGRICLRTGRLREAIESFKISLWSQETVAAHLALAEGYLKAKLPDLARSEIERALALDPASAQAQQWLDRLKRGPGTPA